LLRTQLAIALLVALAGDVAHAGPPVMLKPGAGLRLSADELAYRPGALELRGKVRIELGPLRLQAARLQVELDPQGRPQRLLASGGVDLATAEATGHAGRASLQVAERALQLQSAASVKLRGMKLELAGDQIDLDLGTGGVRVRRARAQLELPAAHAGGSHAYR
jgi:lipopolysaccharide export system protein LptA